jgi:hypothetical protein
MGRTLGEVISDSPSRTMPASSLFRTSFTPKSKGSRR